MAQLNSCSFNCRGWNNGVLTLKNFIDSLDLCFVQEHWLLSDHLHRIDDLSSDFLSLSVSGVDSSVLLCGRPSSGCSILYCRNLASCVVPFESCFVVLDFMTLLVCQFVYIMPSSLSSSLFNEYLNTLGELDGFIHSNHCDVVVIVGDFNVDFDRCNQITSLLYDFMCDHSLCSCDLPFRDDVKFTYEHDDDLSRSWINPVICYQSFSNRISDVRTMHSGFVLSDNSPLLFSIKTILSPTLITKSVSSAN